MSKFTIDLAPDEMKDESRPRPSPRQSRPRSNGLSRWWKIIIIVAILGLISTAVISSSLIFSNDGFVANLSKFNLFGQVSKLVTSLNKKVAGENEDRINILVMGIGGKNHDGGTLADTMILASIKPSTKQVALMSIPRDLWVTVKGYGQMKINAVNAYAEKRQAGSGGPETIKFLNPLLGTNIQYYATFDFDGFIKVIDEFGGVDVTVDNDLIDYQYPIRGKEDIYPIENRFEVLKINKGLQHMDGELALKYARSRHALGIEGSDFARSKRQEKIISALKNKVMSAATVFSPKKINSLLSAYNNHIETNLQVWEMVRLAQIAKDLDLSQIINRSLSDASGGLLHSKMLDGAYVLLPNDPTFDKIRSLWQNIFDSGAAENIIKTDFYLPEPEIGQATSTATSTGATTATSSTPNTTKPAEPAPDFRTEKATIDILNGTFVAGWASQEKNRLTSQGFNVVQAGNAPLRNFTNIYIYDLSSGSNPLTAKELARIYPGATLASKLPSGLTSSADFLIVLGK